MDHSRPNQTPPYTGQQFGNYRIRRLIGQGGFADVYLGRHIYLGTQAAVKILHASRRQTSLDLQAFLDEARIAARLDHPHIIRVLDFGLEGQVPFLVMAYTRNGTIRQQYPHGFRLVPETLLKYVQEIAGALQYLHDKGLIHRDIKPENMLLGPHNEVWLSDFGITIAAHAIAVEDEPMVVGTATYMAPEQIDGRPCLNSDQYALAIVVYEWLSGYPPFRGTLNEIIDKHFHTMPPSLYTSMSLVSQAVENVVFKALAKDPQDRFESVQAFAIALENAFKPRPLPLVLRSKDPQRARPQPPQPRPTQLSSGAGQGQKQVGEHPQQRESGAASTGREQASRTKSEREAWKEIATFSASSLLVSAALACVLAALNVAPFLLQLLMALCLVLLPLAGGLIRGNKALFFLICSIAVTAALIGLVFHDLVFFIVISISLLLLSLLTALAVIFA